ncbi:hypothetical protein FB107DRAFT_263542 [Schizophyllum commune]
MVRNQFYDDPTSLPSGVQRIAYDSDSGRYTFRDEQGRIYLGNPGEGYTAYENSVTAKETRPMFNSEDFHEYNPEHSKLKSFSDILPSSAVTAATPVDDHRQKHNRSPSKLASVARKLTMKKPKDSPRKRQEMSPTKGMPRMHDVVRDAMSREDIAERERERAYRGERPPQNGHSGHRGSPSGGHSPSGYHHNQGSSHSQGGYPSHGGQPMSRGHTSRGSDDPFSDANAVAIKTAAGMRGPPPKPIDYPRQEEYDPRVHGEYRRSPSPRKYRG